MMNLYVITLLLMSPSLSNGCSVVMLYKDRNPSDRLLLVHEAPVEDSIQLHHCSEWCIHNDGCHTIQWSPGPRFNIKMSSYQYRKSHCGDKTVVRSSYLHNGISYTSKMSSLYWIGAQVAARRSFPAHQLQATFMLGKYSTQALAMACQVNGKFNIFIQHSLEYTPLCLAKREASTSAQTMRQPLV